ncbi:(3R)-hydroxyacyl-ACP dehydratase subunit HadA [Hoyosella sp. YIM 151337]|uniref:(3R)-hydroxyacyl-ACP dehydratase subunit HadA n=1 Tax=Hoyosella sp. YIM 151337 TaxID=2992742 RepID=UPI0022363E29|nr:(3R)-hydroxyacyl-ACP dehydratase subunit HadA [Hoyosella sp. YIM 151337]MCW4352846.1 (3R)-hydroxyacyl-ACP dehydratase subunit HadA [Hoyosella sp. YIM 151337]
MSDYYEVGREKVREFATAVKDDHPAHYSEQAAQKLGHETLLAPLTFVSIIGILTTKEMFEAHGWSSDLRNIMQTDQRFIFHRPIVAGDRLTGEAYVESFRHSAGTDIIVTRNTVLDDKGEAVLTAYTTLIRRDDIEIDGLG